MVLSFVIMGFFGGVTFFKAADFKDCTTAEYACT